MITKMPEDIIVSGWFKDFTPGVKCRKSLSYVQSVGLFTVNSKYCVKRKNLNSYLVLYTISGIGHLNYRQNDYVLKKGDAFIIDCNIYHSYYNETEEPWEFQWLHFSGINGECINTITETNPVYNDVNIKTLLDKIQDANIEQAINYDIQSSLLITELCCHFMVLARKNEILKNELPPVVANAVVYIEEFYANKILLDEICKQNRISKYYFCRIFKQFMQCSPYEYLLNYKITMAKRLLRTTGLSVEEITDKLGFNTSSHFIKTFKQRENITPLKYRIFYS